MIDTTTAWGGRPLVSVIVPVFNDTSGLRRCLEALDGQTLPKDRFEVLVVDNGSHPPLAHVVAPFRFARCLVEARRGSYAARNAGVQHATGELLAFTDADCQPAPDWLEELVRIFEGDGHVGAIGGCIEVRVSSERRLAELYELVLTPFPQEQFVEREGFAATANLAVRNSTFRVVGPFDEGLLSSGDREWGNRLIAAGYELRYAAECIVVHPARRTIRALVDKRRRIEGGVSRLWKSAGSLAGRPAPTRLHPPRSSLARTLVSEPQTFGLTRGEGLQVLLLAGMLVAVRIAEGLRLHLGGHPVR